MEYCIEPPQYKNIQYEYMNDLDDFKKTYYCDLCKNVFHKDFVFRCYYEVYKNNNNKYFRIKSNCYNERHRYFCSECLWIHSAKEHKKRLE